MSALQDMQASGVKASYQQRAKLDESATLVDKPIYIGDESKLGGVGGSEAGPGAAHTESDISTLRKDTGTEHRFNASVIATKEAAKSSLSSQQ